VTAIRTDPLTGAETAGRHHVCDACGFRWRDVPWPPSCTNCGVAAHWIATYHHRADALLHEPLALTNHAAS
jgi:hypothetical protein